MTDHSSRRLAVADAIATLGYDGIVRFDRAEPEYEAFSALWEDVDDEAHLALLGIGAGIIDYQLAGDAQRFWQTLEETTRRHGSVADVDDVAAVLDDFADADVNARFIEAKRSRIEKLFDQDFAKWFVDSYGMVAPLRVWERLAETLDNDLDQKTVVFAMKVYDIVHLIVNGTYLDLPTRVPIPCNLHIRRMAEVAGIALETDDERVLQAWEEVAFEVSAQVGHDISLLRIDSIVWQSGQLVSDVGLDPEGSVAALTEHYVELGIDRGAARAVAEELTWSL